jgi:hypothetical protein
MHQTQSKVSSLKMPSVDDELCRRNVANRPRVDPRNVAAVRAPLPSNAVASASSSSKSAASVELWEKTE